MISDAELLRAVDEATSEDFLVYGELGREGATKVALLALERATGSLVVLVVVASVADDGSTELGVDVLTELDNRVPDAGTFCAKCGTKLRPWGRFCQNCGTDSTGQGAGTEEDATEIRAAVEEAIADDYELLGEIRRREGGGRVFFARERQSGRIAALRLNRGKDAAEFELGETMILKKQPTRADAGVSVSVTQMLRKLEPDAAPFGAPVAPRSAPPTPPVAAAAARPQPAPAPAMARPASVAPSPPPVRSAPPAPELPPRDYVADVGAFVRKNAGVFIGLGIGALLALLGWAAFTA